MGGAEILRRARGLLALVDLVGRELLEDPADVMARVADSIR